MTSFVCRIIESIGCFLCESAHSLSVPSEYGAYVLYSGHAPFLQVLKPGVVKLQLHEGGESQFVFIAGGILSFASHEATVWTTKAILLPDEKEETLSALQPVHVLSQSAFLS